jgi:catechol 2,3-dioxygenase
MEVSPETRMGAVELTVADLDRTLDYWTSQIGLRVLSRENGRASLGTDTEVLRFVEEPGARPDTGHTGLYHVALLVPGRQRLPRPRQPGVIVISQLPKASTSTFL